MSALHSPSAAPGPLVVTPPANGHSVTSPDRAQTVARAARRAWLVVWLAFATFCVLVSAGYKLGVEYVTSAEIDLTARTEGLRGSAFVKTPGGVDLRLTDSEQVLQVGSSVVADRAGGVAVRFFDESRMTVLTQARVDLVRMDRGRFINRQTLRLRQRHGPVAYQMQGPATVDVPGGQVQLGRGDVTVWVDGERTRVRVYDGEARLETDGSSLLIRTGERGELGADRKLVGYPNRAELLLANGDFSRGADGWERIDRHPDNDVPGERHFVRSAIGGRELPALRVLRNSVSQKHGETGLRQPLNVDVTGYRSLYVEAWVRVDHASLSGGGQLGSEYPMMLRVEYEGPAEHSRPDWVTGFYYANPEKNPVRLAEVVPQGEWIRYRVNLTDTEEAWRPYRLLALEVLGQGHSYDARVADVRIVGD